MIFFAYKTSLRGEGVAKMERKGKRPVQEMSALLARLGPKVHFLGRTDHLGAGVERITNLLGYKSSIGATRTLRLPYHCVSSCASVEAGLKRPVEGATKGLVSAEKRGVDWYDENSTRFVLKYYAADFEGNLGAGVEGGQWKFSYEPREMWNKNRRHKGRRRLKI